MLGCTPTGLLVNGVISELFTIRVSVCITGEISLSGKGFFFG
jgi:hypothetical protein